MSEKEKKDKERIGIKRDLREGYEESGVERRSTQKEKEKEK